MTRDPRSWLVSIVAGADDAIGFVSGMPYEQFAEDIRTQYAVLWSLSTVDISGRRIPADLRARAPEADWRGMSGLGYSRSEGMNVFETREVWSAVTVALPPFRQRVAALLAELDAESQPAT